MNDGDEQVTEKKRSLILLPGLSRVKQESTGKAVAGEVVFYCWTAVVFAGLVQTDLELPEKQLATLCGTHGSIRQWLSVQRTSRY